jgi:hypothetical protein
MSKGNSKATGSITSGSSQNGTTKQSSSSSKPGNSSNHGKVISMKEVAEKKKIELINQIVRSTPSF